MLINSPLNPREAFFGGRTENIVTRYEVTGTKKMCSLYPYVLKTGIFPLGQPMIYIGEQCLELISVTPNFNLDSVKGIIRCTVLSSCDLFHTPVSRTRQIIVQVCSCCEIFSQADLSADCEFVGAWVSCELRKALERLSRDECERNMII